MTLPRSLLVRLAGLFLALLAAPLTAPLAAQTEVDAPPGPWTHTATGTVFPKTVMGFERGRIFEFDNTGRDVGVGYTMDRGEHRVVVTLYVYPQAPATSCAEEFAGVEEAIVKYPGTQKISEGMALPPSGTGARSALLARYLIAAGAMREDIPALVSEAYLFCSADGAWLVKYRASWDGPAETFPSLTPFLGAFQWNAALGGAD